MPASIGPRQRKRWGRPRQEPRRDSRPRLPSRAKPGSSWQDPRFSAEALMPSGVQTEVKTYQMYINGEWVASNSSKTFPVYDPASEEILAQVPDADADDVNRAVAAAKAAFEEGPWSSTTAQERGRVLFRLAEKIR